MWSSKNLPTLKVPEEPSCDSKEDKPNTSCLTYRYTSCLTYRCTLCNTNVPNMFQNEHSKSLLHRACSKIAATALERTRLYMNLSENNNNVQDTANVYFCAPCATVVKNSNSINHENTVLHLKKMLYERFLNDFIKIYDNNEYFDKIDFEYLSKVNVQNNDIPENQSNENSTEESNVEYILLSNEDEKADTEAKVATNKIILESKEVSKPINNFEINEKRLILNKFTELLTNHTNTVTHKLLLVSNDIIQIKTVDEYVIEVSFDNFNGFFTRNGNTKCQPCQIMIEGSTDSHILTVSHIEMMRVPLLNMHCYRELNNWYKHCVLCNENFVAIEIHQRIQGHINAAKKAIKTKFNAPSATAGQAELENESTEKLIRSNESRIICTGNTPVPVPSTKHITALSSCVSPTPTHAASADNTSVISTSSYRAANTPLKKPSALSLSSHVKHPEGVAVSSVEKKPVIGTPAVYACTSASFDPTPSGNASMLLIQTSSTLKNTVFTTPTPVIARASNTTTVSAISNSVTHPRSLSANSTPLSVTPSFSDCSTPKSSLATIPRPSNNGNTYCHECRFYVRTKALRRHVNATFHKQSVVSNEIEAMKNNDTKSILTSTVDITTYCDICQLFVDKEVYKIHAKAHHNNNFATTNKEIEEKIHCEICNDFIISYLYDSHVEKHDQNNNKVINDKESNNNEITAVENDKDIDVENCCSLKTYCDPCGKRIHTCDFVFHINSKSHKINVSLKSKMEILPDTSIHHHYYIEHNGEISKVMCRICKEEINNENIPGHVNSINHTTKYAKKLRRNEMTVKDKTLYCGLCEMNIRYENDLYHLVLDRHRQKRINAAIGRATDSVDKPVYCFKCEVIVRYQNSAFHEYVHKSILNSNEAADITKLTGKATYVPKNKSKKNTKVDSNKNEIIVSDNACVLRTNCVPCRRRIHTCEFGDHLESVGHKYNVGRINTDVEIPPPPDPEVLNLHDHIKQVFTPIIKFQKDVHCKICNITMCKDNTKIQLIIAHVKSEHHLTKYSDFKKKNEIKEDGNASFCTRCEVEIYHQKEIEHIDSEEHISNMKLTNRCVCCQVSVTNTFESKQEHELSMNHKICEKFLQLAKVFTEKVCLFYYDNTDDLEFLTCKVCDTNVLTDKAQKHLVTVYHILKLNTIMKEHNLTIKDNSFYCDICQVNIEEHCVFIHIKDAEHTSKKADKTKEDSYVLCQLCEKKIFNHPDAITAHELGSPHKNRVNNQHEINWLMAKTASGEDMVCQACLIVVPVKHAENHVEEESHKENRRRRGLLQPPVV